MWEVRAAAVVESLEVCPLCGSFQADLRHVLEVCAGTSSARVALRVPDGVDFLVWVFADEANLVLLRDKVQYVGTCFASVLASQSSQL